MIGQQREFEVRLQRASLDIPWGFRLQGGRECQAPLTIQRVFVGGVSDGHLQRGDVITSIERNDARQMYHKQAEDIIRASRNTLTLTLRRGQNAAYADNGSSTPVSQNTGTWPRAAAAGSVGGGAQGYEEDAEDYSSKTVSELRQKFTEPPPSRFTNQKAGVIYNNPEPGMPSYVPKRPQMFKKKQATGPSGLADPGWVPQEQRRPQPSQQSRYVPRSYAEGRTSPPINRPGRQPRHLTPSQPQTPDQHYEPPAWSGSLRHSGGPRRWELQEHEQLLGTGVRGGPRPVAEKPVSHPPAVSYSGGDQEPVVVHNPKVQALRYGPGSSGPTYEQHSADTYDSSTAKIAHLQYNSPLGLYSRQSAEEAMRGQIRGKPGEDTIHLSGGGGGQKFNPAQSDVYRMVAEEDELRQVTSPVQHHPPPRSGGRPQQRQQQHGGVESQFADLGISDF